MTTELESRTAPAPSRAAAHPHEPVADAVVTAFEHVLSHWEEEEAHRRFIALCQTLGALSYAGGQYRHISDQHDDREAMARKQIDAVVASAAAELFAQRPEPTQRAPIAKTVMLIVSGSALLYTLKLLFDLMEPS